MRVPCGVLLVLATTAAAAEVRPVPDRSDPRLATARYMGAEAIRIEVPVGHEATVLLPPGETVSAVSVAAPADWQVESRDGVALAIRPARPVPDSTMAVLTSARSYNFVLSATPTVSAPLVVRITGVKAAPPFGGAGSNDKAQGLASPSWKLSGRKELWPSSIRDDGAKTYIEWPAEQAIPAVFAVDTLGREEMVNGFMRGAVFTIDRVYTKLLFRIDKAHATARRLSGSKGR